jgi:hypothetical protein
MKSPVDPLAAGVKREHLEPLVRRVLGNGSVEILDWTVETVVGGLGFFSSLYRFCGTGKDGGEDAKWSLILKVLRSPTGGGYPADWDYWNREPLVYRSGLLDELSVDIVAPRCLGTFELEDTTCLLWLEDVAAAEMKSWSLPDYREVAQHFGRMNGAYLRRKRPSYPWLSTRWLRGYVTHSIPFLADLENHLENPHVAVAFSNGVAEGTWRLMDDREMFLETLERLPRTLCHMDAFRRNLFLRKSSAGRKQTVAIDWAYTAIGSIGEELAPLIFASHVFSKEKPPVLEELEQSVFDGYLEGLRETGWNGDERIARLGYTSAASLRYGLGSAREAISLLLNKETHAPRQRDTGPSVEEIAKKMNRARRFLLNLADEARSLMGILD